MTTAELADNLEANIYRLARDTERDTARSLVRYYRRNGRLSDSQSRFANDLLRRAQAVNTLSAAAPAAETIGSMTGIFALFNRAQGHLRRPAVVLSVPSMGDIRVSVAGPASRYAGSLLVKSQVENAYGRRLWFGHVRADGTYWPANTGTGDRAIAVRLTAFAANPAAVAAEHGRLTGRCCFCNLPLTDERSTATGYGPVCARHWGLPWGDRPAEFAEPTLVSAQQRARRTAQFSQPLRTWTPAPRQEEPEVPGWW